jgi:DNA end-binding protein Ku
LAPQGKDYFDDITDEKVPKDMLDLATHIVDTKRGKFAPEKFEDQCEDALKDLPKKKQKGETISAPKAPARSNVVNLMDALRKSLESNKPSAKSEKRPAQKPVKKTTKPKRKAS